MKLKILTLSLSIFFTSQQSIADEVDSNAFLNCKAESCQQQLTKMRKFARRGSPEANYIMGVLYLYGENVEKDEWKAHGYFKRAAEGDMHEAYYMLANMYRNGWGVDKDPAEATEYLLKAANGRSSSAEFEVGLMYLRGDGLDKDLAQGVKYLEEAASKRHAEANYLLGKIYLSGFENIAMDPELGQEYMLKAARRGHGNATDVLADLKAQGQANENVVAWNKPDDDVEVVTVVGQPTNLLEYMDWYSDAIESQKIYDGRSVFRTGRACTRGSGCSVESGSSIDSFTGGLGRGSEGSGTAPQRQ